MPTPTNQKATPVELFNRWKTTGPLYVYRKTSGMTMGGCASALRVSLGTIQNLEDGCRSPFGKPYFKNLCELLQMRAAEVERVWSEWLKRKP